MKRNVLVGVRFSPEEHAYLCEQAEKDVETQKRNGTKICLLISENECWKGLDTKKKYRSKNP